MDIILSKKKYNTYSVHSITYIFCWICSQKLQDLLMRELSNIQQSFPIITHKRLKVIVEKGGLTLDAEELKQVGQELLDFCN